jgi:hypothetical protein
LAGVRMRPMATAGDIGMGMAYQYPFSSSTSTLPTCAMFPDVTIPATEPDPVILIDRSSAAFASRYSHHDVPEFPGLYFVVFVLIVPFPSRRICPRLGVGD